MDVILVPLFQVVNIAIDLFIFALVASATLSWLVAFNVINTRNPVVQTILDMLMRLTEPALRPIRRIIPAMSGLDLSPLILILILIFIQNVLTRMVMSFA